MPTPSAYDVISQQLPKWWKSLQNRPQDFTIADAADIALPHSVSDAAMMAMTGGLGKVANTGLGALAAATYTPDAEGGVLNPKLGALYKLEQMLWKARPRTAPAALPPITWGKDTALIKTPSGDASMFYGGNNVKLNPEILRQRPDAVPFVLDTSMLQGGGEPFYRSLYAALPNTNLVQVGGALSQVNRGRKGMRMADALSIDHVPRNQVEYSSNLNLADDTNAPMTKALLPSDTPLHITPEEFAKLPVDDQTAVLRINQMMGAEDSTMRYAPEHHSAWEEPAELLPRNLGSVQQGNINQSLLNQANGELEARKSINPDFMPNLTPEQYAFDKRADVLSSAYGQNSLDHAKFLMDGLLLPEKYHQSLVDDYVRQLSEIDQAR